MLAQAPGLLAVPPRSTPLLLGTFAANIAAPLPSPLQLNIGTLTITDASSVISQATGQLVISGTPAALSGALASASLPRVAGTAVIFGVRKLTTSGSSKFGLANSAAIPAGPYAGLDLSNATVPRPNVSGGTVASWGEVIGVGFNYWEAAFILRSAGFFICVRESPAAAWVLAFVSAQGSTAVWPHVSAAAAAAQNFGIRNLHAVQLGGPWAVDYGIAKGRIATTVANDTLAADPYGIFEHTITAATGVTQEFNFRYVTDADRWLIRLNQTTGAIQIIEVVATVETVRGTGSVTFTQTNGVAYQILVQVRPAATAGQDTITVITETGSVAESFKDTYTGAATGRNVGLLKVSRAGTNLIAWPRGIPMLEAAA
jgi:hypothetical protein